MAIYYPEGRAEQILKIAHFSDATQNISMSNADVGTVLTFTFSRENSGSSIIINGYAPNSGQNSYHAGCYVEVNGSRKYEATNFISPPGGSGDNEIYGMMLLGGMWTSSELGSTTGNITIKLGWQSRDSTDQKPAN